MSDACSYAGACNFLRCRLGKGTCTNSTVDVPANLTDSVISDQLLIDHVRSLKSAINKQNPIFDARSILTKLSESGNTSLAPILSNFHQRENGIVQAREFLTSNASLPKDPHFVLSLLSQLSADERFSFQLEPLKWKELDEQCASYNASKSACSEIIKDSCDAGAWRVENFACTCKPGFIKTWKFNPLQTRVGGCIAKWGTLGLLAGTAALALTAGEVSKPRKFNSAQMIRVLRAQNEEKASRLLFVAVICMALIVIVLSYFVYKRLTS